MSRAPKSPVKPVAPARVTEVRNSPLPRATASAPIAKKEVTHDAIARRAYEIWQSGQGGSEFENWVRAERELRAGQSNAQKR